MQNNRYSSALKYINGSHIGRLALAVIVMILSLLSVQLSAKNKFMPKMYAFGVALSLIDSTVYLTNVVSVDSVWVDAKTDFVINRSDYTTQLESYLSVVDLTQTMCVVTFGNTEKKVQKKLDKITKRYSNTKKYHYRIVNIDGFTLQTIPPTNVELQRKSVAFKAKKSKKARREKAQTITNQ